jgi:hypothetical protein
LKVALLLKKNLIATPCKHLNGTMQCFLGNIDQIAVVIVICCDRVAKKSHTLTTQMDTKIQDNSISAIGKCKLFAFMSLLHWLDDLLMTRQLNTIN